LRREAHLRRELCGFQEEDTQRLISVLRDTLITKKIIQIFHRTLAAVIQFAAVRVHLSR
jgi:hypothetical protein